MSSALTVATSVLAGMLTWSLAEYCVHRWLGHDHRTRPNFFAAEHVRHHAEGNYFAPTAKKAAAVGIMLVVIGLPAAWLAGAAGLGWVSGFVGLYLGYEVLHRRLHTHAGWGFYGRWARRHHFHHHFVDPHHNHGVTSPLWDYVFRTHARPGVVQVPPKLMMPWLGTPETGVRPEFASMFALRTSRRAAVR